MNSDLNEADLIYHELHSVVRRYLDESDKLTAFEVVGALEAVKADFMETLVQHNRLLREAEDEPEP
jgi:hypothetical protein